jgi:hypothetical protein
LLAVLFYFAPEETTVLIILEKQLEVNRVKYVFLQVKGREAPDKKTEFRVPVWQIPNPQHLFNE